MAEIKLPELEENIESGTVTQILVSKDDTVKSGQTVIELETDKAVVEIPSDKDGKITEVLVSKGDEVEVGQSLMKITPSDGGASKEQERSEEKGSRETSKESQPKSASRESGQKESQQADQDRERKEGGEDRQETDKDSGTKEQTDRDRAEKPKEAGEQPQERRGEGTEPMSKASDRREVPLPAAPSVRRRARELGVELAQVSGSGPGGRITMSDVESGERADRETGAHGATNEPRELPDFSQWGKVERRKLGNVRRRTGEHLVYGWTVAPHVTQFDAADITQLEALRHRHAPASEQEGGKLTLTVFLLKAAVGALKSFPDFNASLDSRQQELVVKHYYHVGVAVETDRGLLVPVVRDVDRKNLFELAVEVTQLAAKAREGKLKIEEMRGGNFTVSNSGALGGRGFTPVLNWPEVAILGVSQARTEPVHVEGEFEPRLMLPLALSFDHRVIDGADGVRFLRRIAEALEDPMQMVLRG